MKQDFRERLREGPILCDGAMGTVLDLYEYPDLPHDVQNLKNPDIVERVHREYIEAGAEIIQTNTFSANRFRLQQYHLEDRLEPINRIGVELARRAAIAPAFFNALSDLSGGRMIPVPGGVLIRSASGDILGSVGISGDTSENDEACAVYGIKAGGLTPDTGQKE